MARHVKTYTVVAEFNKISYAIECVGVLKSKDVNSHVESGEGNYLVVVSVLKTKRATEELLEELHNKFNYTFTIKKGK